MRNVSKEQVYDYSQARNVYAFVDMGFGNVEVVVIQREDNNNYQGFTVEDIENGDDIAFCSGTKGLVREIKDHTGNNNGIQTDPTKQALWIDANGNRTQSYSKPALLFDGNQGEYNFNLSNSQYSQMFAVQNSQINFNHFIRFSGAVLYETNLYVTANDNLNFNESYGLFTIDNINFIGRRNAQVEDTANNLSQIFNRLILENGYEGKFSALILFPYNTDVSQDINLIEADINRRFNNQIY